MNNLEQFESDDILYHYTKTTTALEHILYKNELRLSDRVDSKDPIENMTHRTTIEGGTNGVVFFKPSHYMEVFNDIHERMRRLKQVCFCKNDMGDNFKDKPDKPYEFYGCMKPRMWEQYADNYNGVCLILSKAELLKQLDGNYKPDDVKYVTYNDLNEKENKIDSSELSESYYEACLEKLVGKIDEFIFHKHEDYKGENEYRICSYSDKVPNINIESAIKAIVVSGKNSQYYKEQLCTYGIELGIDVISIAWRSDGIKLINMKDKFEYNKGTRDFALRNNIKITDGFIFL
jgi:hypothetical protein